MKKLAICASAAAMAALLVTFGAVAQEKGKAAPAAKAPVATTEKTAKKPPSACKGQDEASCKAKEAVCHWIGEITTKAGKTRKAHCRTRVKSPKKKDAPK